MGDRILVTNIQRFSLHDGPGIRTTVFCKGCSLRCPWCANPENLGPYPEEYIKDGRPGKYGRYLSCEELFDEVMKDEIFYRQQGQGTGLEVLPGGVTFSGGEPLLQADRLEPVWRELKEKDVHLCAETCLFLPVDMLALALRYIDLFYVDIKILDAERCKNVIHGDLKQYLTNIDILFGGNKQTVFRIPVIGAYTDDEKNCGRIIDLLKKYKPLKVELMKEHNLGQSKYLSLGKEPLELHTVTDAFMERYKRDIEETTGIPTEICRV